MCNQPASHAFQSLSLSLALPSLQVAEFEGGECSVHIDRFLLEIEGRHPHRMTGIGGRRSRAPWKGTNSLMILEIHHRIHPVAAGEISLEVQHRKGFSNNGRLSFGCESPTRLVVVHTAAAAAPEPRKFPPLSIVGCEEGQKPQGKRRPQPFHLVCYRGRCRKSNKVIRENGKLRHMRSSPQYSMITSSSQWPPLKFSVRGDFWVESVTPNPSGFQVQPVTWCVIFV